jgi:hypothetical protein
MRRIFYRPKSIRLALAFIEPQADVPFTKETIHSVKSPKLLGLRDKFMPTFGKGWWHTDVFHQKKKPAIVPL